MLFNEPKLLKFCNVSSPKPAQNRGFSALQRAEIAEIRRAETPNLQTSWVSVLFNEPKLLKFLEHLCCYRVTTRFSALQRAEIAEIRSRAGMS